MYTEYPHQWSRPQEFNPTSEDDRALMDQMLESGDAIYVQDKISSIANELFEMLHPGATDNDETRKKFVNEYVEADSGKFFYFDWLKTFVRYPDKADYQALRTFRERELVTQSEQSILLGKTALTWGLSVGSNALQSLVRAGIGGTHAFGDYDSMSISNLNRTDATMLEVGMGKVDDNARKISLLDPYIQQVHYRQGATEKTLEAAMGLKPDIIFDAVDDLSIKAMSRIAAAQHGVPHVMVTDLDDRVLVDVERYDLDEKTRPFHGMVPDKLFDALVDRTELTKKQQDHAKMKIVGVNNITPKMLKSRLMIGSTLVALPQHGTTARAAGSAATIVAREILLGRRMDSGRHIISYDKLLNLQAQMNARETIATLASFVKNHLKQK